MTQSIAAADWLEIGKIVAPQGLKGEVRVLPSTDFPERFACPCQRWIRSADHRNPSPIKLLRAYPVPGKTLYIVQLAGIDNRDRAEALRGHQLLVPVSDRPQLQGDEYHVADLVGLAVYHQETAEKVGIVQDVYITGNDVLEIRLEPAFLKPPKTTTRSEPLDPSRQKKRAKSPRKTPQSALIPFVKAIVPVIDIAQGRIEILPPPGLLEANQ